MNKDLVVGIDAGTSVIKAVAFDQSGAQVAVASVGHQYHQLGGGAVEQDIDQIWRSVASVLRKLGAKLDRLAERCIALGVTGQGDGTVLIDAAGEPVGPGWLWLDSRASGLVEEFERSDVMEKIYQHTGVRLTACQQSAQLAWMKRHTPDRLAKAATAFHPKDWLYFKLTGRRCTDPSEGTFTFGDFRTRAYEGAILDALGIAEFAHLLPVMVDGSNHADPLTKPAANATGLLPGTPVSLGFLDAICTGLGGGLYAPGEDAGVCIIGTTGLQMRLDDRPDDIVLPDEASGYIIPFPVPGHVARVQSSMAGTINIDWITDRFVEAAGMLGRDVERSHALDILDKQILEGKPASILYHPYIHEAGERGPFVDARARAQFHGLSTNITFLDMARAVYEGLALAGRDCFSAMGDLPREIRIAGGASRSAAFTSILASCMGVPVRETSREEAGALGAAMIAAVAAGLFDNMAACARAWVDPTLGGQVMPDPALTPLYDRQFDAYVAARKATRPLWRLHGRS